MHETFSSVTRKHIKQKQQVYNRRVQIASPIYFYLSPFLYNWQTRVDWTAYQTAYSNYQDVIKVIIWKQTVITWIDAKVRPFVFYLDSFVFVEVALYPAMAGLVKISFWHEGFGCDCTDTWAKSLLWCDCTCTMARQHHLYGWS